MNNGGSKVPIGLWKVCVKVLVVEGKVLFSRNVKRRILGLEMVPKENFLPYSTQFVFLIISLVSGNVVMVITTDMCGKISITGEWIYGIT